MADALVLQGINKNFGGLRALRDIDLRIAVGDRRLVLGQNGAGKTTLFNVISGDLKPTGGKVTAFGEEITGMPPHGLARRHIARTYQILTLFPRNTLQENAELALIGLSPVRWNAVRGPDRELRDKARAALAKVGLEGKRDTLLAETSYGEKRRVEIALALAQQPKLLLLDEPLAGLSRPEREAIKELIAGIGSDVTIVMIEHDMDVALDLASSITVMHHGAVLADGVKADVLADPRVQEIYLAG